MQQGCCIPEPPRAPLISGALESNVSEEFSEAINILRSVSCAIHSNSVKQATNQHLFQWQEFPVELPSSILDVSVSMPEQVKLCEILQHVPLANIFTAPEFDECELLSKDSHGNSKPLNRHQLIQLRRTAQFDVDSMNFIGEVHTWKISPFFLKGTDHIRKTLLEDLQMALAELVIRAHDRMVSKRFSIAGALRAGYRDCFVRIIDLLFGWPCVNHGDVDRKLMEERLRFLTCELSVKSNQRKRVMDFWDMYEQFMTLPRDTPIEQLETRHPPYRFVTPARIPIDLRLHNSVLLDRCLAIIHELRQPALSGWFQDFKEQAISRFRDEGKSIPEIKRLVRQEALREYASRLFDAMRKNGALRTISQGIAEPLIQQATFSLILAEAKDSFMHAWLAHQEAAEHQLRRKHPVLYHIEEWRSRQLTRIQRQYFETHKFDVHEFVLSKCASGGLEQHAFFVSRDLLFLRDRERLLREQLEKSSSFPDTQFIFSVPAQLLRHWRVYRKHVSYTTTYELTDTILLSRRPSSNDPILPMKRSIKRITTSGAGTNSSSARDPSFSISYPRKPPTTDRELGPQDFEVHTTNGPDRAYPPTDIPLVDLQHLDEAHLITQPLVDDEGSVSERVHQPEYVVQSSLIYKASTRYFMWRWLVFFVCTYSWFLRVGQLLFITIPFRSALSLTALFKPSPIYLKLEIDQDTGYLFYNKTFYQDTVLSRIRRLWSDIRASRTAFDATPSKGMLDKAAARPLHWIWSYVFRGFLASVLLLIFWPPVCLVVSTLSLLAGLTLPVVVPFVSLTLHLLGLLFWDAYKPASRGNRLFPVFEVFFVHFLVRFLLQFCMAILVTVILCPVLSILKFFWAIARYCGRSVWDGLVFHCVLRRLARIPAREDFMVKRISGPGTATNHYYQARPVDILIILVGQLELLELRLWRRQMESMAEKPLEAYKKLTHSLSWLSLAPQTDGEVYGSLCRQTKVWRTEISSRSEERAQALQLDLKPNQSHRIKLSDRDLRLALRMGTELTECFYRSRIATRLQILNQSPSTWWSIFSLANEDFLGKSIKR
ncbi:Solute carrier family 13 (Sodium-dependent dicarboxylate transporter) member 2/3/5 [Fasciola gigantica]|uniref:Solute carrier family 13 (Sodium-dependent dicarboxylate transporter) member 2/3/5 n=1 Tax=Fasciola gigantica TaxID=46835 RepID=A0A504YJ53_FASGI|nr:Solute carrier family 13 (Sodium-dependent dicarboxylate transporter) member 2/3/5 [Fasciola gigantica]